MTAVTVPPASDTDATTSGGRAGHRTAPQAGWVLVVDPFVGSGTTAAVCQRLGRRFVGCDVDAVAVATARRRLAEVAAS